MGTVLGPLHPEDPAIAAMQELPRPAPWWQLILPMLFGQLIITYSNGLEIRHWLWRGTTYIERVRYIGTTTTDVSALSLRVKSASVLFSVTAMLPDTGMIVTAYYKDADGAEQSCLAFYTPADTTEAEGEWEGYYINEGWYQTNSDGDILGPLENVHRWSSVQAPT